MRTTALQPAATPARNNAPFFNKGAGPAMQQHSETESAFFPKKNTDAVADKTGHPSALATSPVQSKCAACEEGEKLQEKEEPTGDALSSTSAETGNADDPQNSKDAQPAVFPQFPFIPYSRLIPVSVTSFIP